MELREYKTRESALKYNRSEKGAETRRRCYENNLDERRKKNREYQKERSELMKKLKLFYETYKDDHPEFQISPIM